MSEGSLVEIVRAGLSWAALGLLPVVAASCAAAALFGVIAYRLGLSDTALSLVVRALAAGVALYLVGAELIDQTQAVTTRAWRALGDAGRGTLEVVGPVEPVTESKPWTGP